jgi:HSP20 family molecular chaperone IbpA
LNIAGLQSNDINLTIYNGLGVKVRELDLNEVQSKEIDLSTLQAGSYVLYFGLPDGQSFTKKITKI